MLVFNILLGLFLGFVLFSAVMALCTLAAGLIMGYSFLYIRFLAFYIKKENGGLRFNISGAQLNSQCKMYKKGESKSQCLIFNLLPCIFGVIFLAALFAFYKFLGADNFVLKDCILGGVFYAGAHLIVNIEFVREFLYTDEGRDILAKEIAASNMLTGDIRPRDAEVFTLPPEIKHYNEFKLKQLLCEYYRLLDTGDTDSLAPYIGVFEKNTPRFNSFAYLPYIYEQIFYETYIYQNNGIHGLFNEVSLQLTSDKTVFAKRVYAYYLYYGINNKQKALDIANEGLTAADKYEFKGMAQMEKELLEKLIRQIKNERTE
ncbi:MAG: hypothetical protein IJR59_01525 [Firmicutes bacterium]|nr:hypothetical protein [Bacillota bacterium]